MTIKIVELAFCKSYFFFFVIFYFQEALYIIISRLDFTLKKKKEETKIYYQNKKYGKKSFISKGLIVSSYVISPISLAINFIEPENDSLKYNTCLLE